MACRKIILAVSLSPVSWPRRAMDQTVICRLDGDVSSCRREHYLDSAPRRQQKGSVNIPCFFCLCRRFCPKMQTAPAYNCQSLPCGMVRFVYLCSTKYVEMCRQLTAFVCDGGLPVLSSQGMQRVCVCVCVCDHKLLLPCVN